MYAFVQVPSGDGAAVVAAQIQRVLPPVEEQHVARIACIAEVPEFGVVKIIIGRWSAFHESGEVVNDLILYAR